MRCVETIIFTALVLLFAWLAESCAAAEKILEVSCKAACFACRSCPLVQEAMEGAGGGEPAEEPTPEPTPPVEPLPPPVSDVDHSVTLRTWDGALAGGSR